MKKVTAILLGTLIASSAALAQTNQVLSRNAVGYIKRTVPANGLDFVTLPFVNLSGSANTISNVFPAASNLTQISLWNVGDQKYDTYLRSKGTWGVAGSNVLARGAGFFIQTPVQQEFFLMGEVPDRFSAPTTTVTMVEGIVALGLGYPVDVQWSNTAAATSLPNLSQFSAWNKATTSYVTLVKSKGGWGATPVTINPGDGFFVTKPSGTGGSLNWNQAKPYTWP